MASADSDLDLVVTELFNRIGRLRIRLQSEPLEALGELRSIVKDTRRRRLHAPMARAIAALVEVNHFLGRMREMDRQMEKLLDAISLIEDRGEQTLMRSVYAIGLEIRGRPDEALRIQQAAKAVFEELEIRDERYISVLYCLSHLLRREGKTDAALEYLYRCSELVIDIPREREPHRQSWMGNIATQMGAIYQDVEEWDKALQFMQKAADLLLANEFVVYAIGPLEMIGRTYLERGDFDQAFRHFERALDLSRTHQSRGIYVALLPAVGRLYNRMGRHREALEIWDEFTRVSDEEATSLTTAHCLHVAADAYRSLGERDNAFREYHRLLEITDGDLYPSGKMEVHKALAELYEESGDAANALFHHKEYATLYETLYGKQQQRAVARAEQRKQQKEAFQQQQLLEERLNEAESEIEDGRRELNALTIDARRQRIALERLSALAKASRNGALPDAQKLLEEMREILSGAHSPADRNRLLDEQFERTHREFIQRLRKRSTALTPTEIKITVLIRLGMASKEIADTLFSAPATVETHRKRIRRKLGVPPQTNLTTHLIEI